MISTTGTGLARWKRPDRGATFILVLAMLSILLLIAAAFSYSSRLEAIASTNFSEKTQAQAWAASGLSSALPLIQQATSLASPLQQWHQVRIQPVSQPASGTRSAGDTRSSQRDAETRQAVPGPAQISVQDLSGRVNLNTVSSPDALEHFLQSVFSPNSSEGRSGLAHVRANALASCIGCGDRDTTSGDADLRQKAAPGRKRLESLAELRATARKSNLFTPAELNVLADYVTVFSQSPEIFNRSDGTAIAKVDPTTATVYQVLNTLKDAFPAKDLNLLMQFAANLVDYTDPDDKPTLLPDPVHPEVWHTIIGVEQTPLITEVYPDSVTKVDGDQGQFVEIYNPWAKPMAMANWHLSIGGSPTVAAQGGVLINVVLPPGGYLIITDNYDKPSDKSLPETGSFLSIFGRTRDQAQRQVVEAPSLELPDENSFVTLSDAAGNMVDVFAYTATAAPDSRISYQRNDPRVRAFETAEATPFAKPPRTVYTASSAAEEDLLKQWEHGNAGSVAPFDLLNVSTAYLGFSSAGNKALFRAHPWQKPEYKHEENTEVAQTNMDAHLLDVFIFSPAKAERDSGDVSVAESGLNRKMQAQSLRSASPRTSLTSGDAGGFITAFAQGQDGGQGRDPIDTWAGARDVQTSSSTRRDTASTVSVCYSYGKINVNTCPKEAFFSLDTGTAGSNAGLVTADLVKKIEAYRQHQVSSRKTPFINISDFLVQFFPKPMESQRAALGRMVSQLTVSSSAFEVTAENRLPEVRRKDSSRRPTTTRMRWVIALDQQPYSLVSFAAEP